MTRRFWLVLLLALVVVLTPAPAMAYIGPGGGLSAIGAVLAAVVAILAALFGFIWYPIRRWLRKRKRAKAKKTDGSV